MPWLTADGDYSNLGLPTRLSNDRPLAEGETVEAFIASELDANPTLTQMTLAALDVLGDDSDGFWLSIEGGDIDWAMHDNNLDNSIGAMLSFDMAVGAVQDWIAANGGYEENLLLVTADHDHYFTLNNDFPTQLQEFGAEALTIQLDENGQPLLDEEGNRIDEVDTAFAAHYWGSDPEVMNGWAHHTSIPVPVYYQGAGADVLTQSIGSGFEQYGFDVPGIEGHVDQVHIAQAMEAALLASSLPAPNEVIGTNDDDVLIGTADNDLMFGFAGNDTLLGGDGSDVLFGGEGNDFLLGGNGENILFGGAGTDIFALSAGEGVDIIMDFESSDLLGLTGGISASGLYRVQDGANTVIGTYEGDLLAVVFEHFCGSIYREYIYCCVTLSRSKSRSKTLNSHERCGAIARSPRIFHEINREQKKT